MTSINHVYQPTGNSCGPTCLFMVMKYISNMNDSIRLNPDIKYTIDDISYMCGTDWEVGTPPNRMEKGMKLLKMVYTEHMCSPRPYELVRLTLDLGNIPILRTITKGIPHWIIVSSYSIDEIYGVFLYDVLDPWLGSIKYSEQQLNDVWKPREYQFFEINTEETFKKNYKLTVDAETGKINLGYNY